MAPFNNSLPAVSFIDDRVVIEPSASNTTVVLPELSVTPITLPSTASAVRPRLLRARLATLPSSPIILILVLG